MSEEKIRMVIVEDELMVSGMLKVWISGIAICNWSAMRADGEAG